MDGVETGDGRLEACRACSCLLVPQRLLATLLERACERLRGKVDPNARIQPLPEIAEHPDCPTCHHPMSRDDYCQAGVAKFSRCGRCTLLWLHAEQLAVMSVMWARMAGPSPT